ncbi:cytochrome d ubiquinol oxidase subunit 2 [Actinobacillus delphinicola]|uniref:Cytochrome d ubiquinol oxidase subunit II n=1 Tax=Actinobacillus delphinicola TaxID=51161 RepID=A0A448TV16_9PAST|nr:cytochrome d ubiquinol oxidase subunit II [Actinobacillus delphinicola]MDG6897908.1 cytochrome d ubiquinol oxidase subunit 2 [Actinobacillus delphinicola]VEJ09773.1 cytochrome d ubiquinol oxidase subunit II [Actinobacillus delphinicola]
MIDYEFLRFVWWILIIVLLIGFSVTDGFDMGVLTLLPFEGKKEVEKRIMINTIAPHWDGNQVWLLTAGGAMFAAWPIVYSVSFSGFFIAMILVLGALFFRPVGFEYRGKVESTAWRKWWDFGLFLGGFIPSVVFGVAIGNLLEGVPFHFNELMQATYTGTFWGLLNPFALLCGILSCAMLTTHGANWLQMKTTDALRARSQKISEVGAIITLILFVIGGIWLYFKNGFVLTSEVNPYGPSNPMGKDVVMQAGAWFNNYNSHPVLYIFPLIAIIAPIFNVIFSKANRNGWAFFSSALTMLGIITTFAIAMFPFIMPSSTNPGMSLLMWDATSSQLTLTIMFVLALIFTVILLAYTIWAYIKMFGRIDANYIESGKNPTY